MLEGELNLLRIEEYGKDVNNLEVSADELLLMLKGRERLENEIQNLSIDERHKLIGYDLQLIKNAKRMSEQIGLVYDFSVSKEPVSKWWWHLDKVANGEIEFTLDPIININKDTEDM